MAISRNAALKVLSICKLNLLSSSFRSFAHRKFSSGSTIPVHLQRVGFIGLGNMGFHMANNLINSGFQVTVHDINCNAMKKFSDNGIPTKETPIEVAETSDVIVTMLPSSSNVLEVYTGTYGLLHGGNHLRPWLLIDSSTIDPRTSRMLSALVSKCVLKEKKGCWETPTMLDAPVSGSVLGAEAGTLTFMVGGLEEVYLAARNLFNAMGKHTIYCGGSGNGTAAKICNNLAMAISMLGVSEAFTLGQSLGIKASTLTRIFNLSSARCWSRFYSDLELQSLKGCFVNCWDCIEVGIFLIVSEFTGNGNGNDDGDNGNGDCEDVVWSVVMWGLCGVCGTYLYRLSFFFFLFFLSKAVFTEDAFSSKHLVLKASSVKTPFDDHRPVGILRPTSAADCALTGQTRAIKSIFLFLWHF